MNNTRWKEAYSNSPGPSSTSSLDTLARLRDSTIIDKFRIRGMQPRSKEQRQPRSKEQRSTINNANRTHGSICETEADCTNNMRCYHFNMHNKRCICRQGNIFVDHDSNPQCVNISQDS